MTSGGGKSNKNVSLLQSYQQYSNYTDVKTITLCDTIDVILHCLNAQSHNNLSDVFAHTTV